MSKNVELGKRIKSIRVEKNLSQKRFGEKIGVSDKSISAYETGKATPPVFVLESIANVFGTSVLIVKDKKQEYLRKKLLVLKDSISEIEDMIAESLSL